MHFSNDDNRTLSEISLIVYKEQQALIAALVERSVVTYVISTTPQLYLDILTDHLQLGINPAHVRDSFPDYVFGLIKDLEAAILEGKSQGNRGKDKKKSLAAILRGKSRGNRGKDKKQTLSARLDHCIAVFATGMPWNVDEMFNYVSEKVDLRLFSRDYRLIQP